MNRRRGLSLLLALAMLLTAMPFVGAAAAEGDVAEAAYIRNGTEGAVAAYTKGEEGNLTKDGEFAAGAVWAYLGVETIAEKDYYKANDGSAEKYVEKAEGIASITHKLEVAGGGSFQQGEAHAVTATVKEGGTDVTADYTVKYKVNENEAAAEPPVAHRRGELHRCRHGRADGLCHAHEHRDGRDRGARDQPRAHAGHHGHGRRHVPL